MEKRSTKVTVRDEKEEEEEETLKTIPVTHVFRLCFAPAHVHNFHDQTHTHGGTDPARFFSLLLFFFYLCLLFFALSLSLVCALWCCCCCCYRLEYPPSFSVHTSSTTTADDYWFTDALESSEHLHTNSHLHAHFSARTHTYTHTFLGIAFVQDYKNFFTVRARPFRAR